MKNTKSQKKRTPKQRAVYRRQQGLRIVDRLESAANGDAEILAEVDLIREALRPENIFCANKLTGKDGGFFAGKGSLCQSYSRLDPFYRAEEARRTRKRLSKDVAQIRPAKGQFWRLVTLTVPTVANVELATAIKLVCRAWTLFRKRKWWIDRVRAGVKSIEFTLGDERRRKKERRGWKAITDGYHVHLHLLVLSGWIEWARLGREWTECLRLAAQEESIDLEIKTVHGRAIVDVRLVTNRKRHKK
jgi:hypothetical protein